MHYPLTQATHATHATHPTHPTHRGRARTAATVLGLGVAALLGACASAPPTDPKVIGEFRPGMLRGYLDRAELPDSLALLPPPPAADSARQAADQAAYLATRAAAGAGMGRDDDSSLARVYARLSGVTLPGDA